MKQPLSLENLGDRYGIMLRNMEICFSKLNPNTSEGDSFHGIVTAIEVVDDPKRVDRDEIIESILSEEITDAQRKAIFTSPLGPLLLSVVFLTRAKFASRHSGRVKAWSYMTDAYYWGGIANWSIERYKQQGMAAQLAFRMRSASGGNKRNEGIEELRQFVFSLVRQPVLDGGDKWPTIQKAAEAIAPQYLAKAKAEDKAASPNNAVRLLKEWIGSQMADVKDFIKTKENG